MTTYSSGYCIGTDANGQEWAWGRKTQKLIIDGKLQAIFHALRVSTDKQSGRVTQTMVETFLSKPEVIAFCKARCERLY